MHAYLSFMKGIITQELKAPKGKDEEEEEKSSPPKCNPIDPTPTSYTYIPTTDSSSQPPY
jgi:hypothetical protein